MMLKHLFSFEGRIGRTEYAITYGCYVILLIVLNVVRLEGPISIIGRLIIPSLWILFAQGAKRCHDMDKSGWWQLVPFYVFVMLFQAGDEGANEYGFQNSNEKDNPSSSLEKEIDSIGKVDAK